jgi:hypothetical protein
MLTEVVPTGQGVQSVRTLPATTIALRLVGGEHF